MLASERKKSVLRRHRLFSYQTWHWPREGIPAVLEQTHLDALASGVVIAPLQDASSRRKCMRRQSASLGQFTVQAMQERRRM